MIVRLKKLIKICNDSSNCPVRDISGRIQMALTYYSTCADYLNIDYEILRFMLYIFVIKTYCRRP